MSIRNQRGSNELNSLGTKMNIKCASTSEVKGIKKMNRLRQHKDQQFGIGIMNLKRAN